MPVSMSFNSLLTDLRRYLERGAVVDTEVYDQLPSLVNLAEREIARRLKVLGFLNVVTTTMAAGTSVYAKPDRWRNTVSMNFGTGTSNNTRVQLFPRAYEVCRMYWPDSSQRGVPMYYSDYEYSHWLITPTPDAAYPIEILYEEQPPLLDDTNQTNWITDYIPNILLYRALLEATPFLKNDERIPVWQNMYDTSISTVNGEDLKRIVDRNVTRQGV